MRFSFQWVAAPAAGLVALACGFAAAPAPGDKSASSPSGDLVVHEWGTFSTFSGSDGNNLEFYPYDNDLPEFVHGYLPKNSKAGPKGGTISLETPVLYFYTDRPLSASVHVDLPKGTLTEWYPHAERTDKTLAWDGIEVRPAGKVKLPWESQKSRYYAARETDAAPLRTVFEQEGGTGTEQEKFLFYRGVGSFDMPLTVRARRGGNVTVSWDGKAPDGDLFLVQIQNGKVRFQPFRLDRTSKDGAEADVKLPDADATTEQLGDAVVKQLIDKGLYEKEARAMVKTWRDAWFGEEGTRVLYILPSELTDELLPLQVEPKPSALVRVLVGRHDVLTPEREKQIDGWVARYNGAADDAGQRAAAAELAKLGRYRSAAWNEADARLKKIRK
jgi:hypothetical protein